MAFTRTDGTVPPVIYELMRHRLNELIHIGEPFLPHSIITEQIVELARAQWPDEDAEVYQGKNRAATLQLATYNVIKSRAYRDRLFRRWDRSTLKAEHRDRAAVIYPSNDRAHFRLSEVEIFLPWGASAKDATWPMIRRFNPDLIGQDGAKPQAEADAEYDSATESGALTNPNPTVNVNLTTYDVNQVALGAMRNLVNAIEIGAQMVEQNLAQLRGLVGACEKAWGNPE